MRVSLDWLSQPFDSLTDVITKLALLEQAFRETHDRRAVFATAYVVSQEALQHGLASQVFRDSQWIERHAVAFANLYRTSLLCYERGIADSHIAPAWRTAFDAAAQAQHPVIVDLLLGINAHVNHDLPLSLLDMPIDPERETRQADFFAVNDCLHSATLAVRNRVAQLYAPGLKFFHWFGLIQRAMVDRGFETSRSRAWSAGVELVESKAAGGRADLVERIASAADALARLILSRAASSRLLRILKAIERPVGAGRAPACASGMFEKLVNPVGY